MDFDWGIFGKGIQQAGQMLAGQIIKNYNDKEAEQRSMRLFQQQQTISMQNQKSMADYANNLRKDLTLFNIEQEMRIKTQWSQYQQNIAAFYGSLELQEVVSGATKGDVPVEKKILAKNVLDLMEKQANLMPLDKGDKILLEHLPPAARLAILDQEKKNILLNTTIETNKKKLAIQEKGETRQLEYLRNLMPGRELSNQKKAQELIAMQNKYKKDIEDDIADNRKMYDKAVEKLNKEQNPTLKGAPIPEKNRKDFINPTAVKNAQDEVNYYQKRLDELNQRLQSIGQGNQGTTGQPAPSGLDDFVKNLPNKGKKESINLGGKKQEFVIGQVYTNKKGEQLLYIGNNQFLPLGIKQE